MHEDLIVRLRDASDLQEMYKLCNEAADALESMQADAARYRWLRSQHEVDDERASDNNYGKSYPPRTMTVFVDDGHDGLDPLPCDPGALDAAIDAALSGEQP